MSSAPRISVCLIVYNGEKFLRPAIDSILAQTERSFELLVGDNASTDSTPDILRSYEDPRVVPIFREKNLGPFGNVNDLVRRARGEFVALLHADDIYHPDFFAKSLTVFDGNARIGFTGCHPRVIDENDRPTKRRATWTGRSRSLSLRDLIVAGASVPPLLVTWTPSIIVRQEVIPSGGIFLENSPYGIAEDQAAWLRLGEKSLFGFIDEPLMSYRVHSDQGTARFRSGEIESPMPRILKDMQRKHFPDDRELIGLIERYERYAAYETAKALNASGRFQESQQTLFSKIFTGKPLHVAALAALNILHVNYNDAFFSRTRRKG